MTNIEYRGRTVQDETGEVTRDLPMHSLISQVRGFCLYSKTLSTVCIGEEESVGIICFSFEKR